MLTLKTKIIAILVLLATIAVTIFYWFFISTIIEYKKVSASAANELFNLQQKRERLSELRNIVRVTETDRNRLDSYFIKKDEAVNFIRQIETLGRQAEAPIEIVTVGIEAVRGDIDVAERLVLHLKAEGDLTNIVHLFSLLESMPYATRLSSARIEERAGAVDGGMPRWQGTAVLSVLKFK
jgi:hypothetical protein